MHKSLCNVNLGKNAFKEPGPDILLARVRVHEHWWPHSSHLGESGFELKQAVQSNPLDQFKSTLRGTLKKEGGHMKEISLKPSAKQEIGKEREREWERDREREREGA